MSDPMAPGAQTGDGSIRASDADREKVATTLRDQFAEGRLTFDELQERLEQTYGSKTLGELEPLTKDLPVPAATSPPASKDALEEARKKRLANRIVTYVVLMLFLTLIWFASGRHGSFWPIWPIIVGGFILAMDVLGIERGGARRRRRYERMRMERRGELPDDEEHGGRR